MKPILVLTFILLFQINNSWGQNLYLTASAGYSIGFGKDDFQNFIYNKLVGAFYTQNKERFEYSLGKGINFNFGLGYTMKRNIGFELEASYLMGMKTIGETDFFESDIFRKEIWGRFYRINPSVHFICPLKRLSMKMSIGGLVGFGKMYLNQEVTYGEGISSFKYENEFSGGYYAGFKAGIGVLYPINEHLRLTADVNWVNAYFSPMRARVTKFVSGGKDNTEILDTWEREIRYSNSIDKQFYSPNEPAHMLRENFAASSIGLQVGIQWNLWTKMKKEEDEEAKTD